MAENQNVHSKTKELQEWLEGKIRIIQRDIALLETAISRYDSYHNLDSPLSWLLRDDSRYGHLTSDEMQAKASEDRGKLITLKEQLELLCSASKLDITEVVQGCDNRKSFWKANIVREFPDPYLELILEKENYVSKNVRIWLGSRRLVVKSQALYPDFDRYVFDGVSGILWLNNIIIELKSRHNVILERFGHALISMC